MNTNQSYFINYSDFRMPDWLLKANLSQGAKLTYSVLACCAGGKDHVWPSQEYLAEKISASVRSVQRYLNELISFGLIEKARQWVKGKMRHIYRFLAHELTVGRVKNQIQNVVSKVAPKNGKEPHSRSQERRNKLSPCPSEIKNILPPDTTICRVLLDSVVNRF